MKILLKVCKQIKKFYFKVFYHTVFLGILSLLWLLFRSGTKPSRLHYPCQKAAASHLGLLFPGFLLHFANFHLMLKPKLSKKLCVKLFQVILVLFSFFTIVYISSGAINLGLNLWKYSQLRKLGPIGKHLEQVEKMNFATLPGALAISSPHRVVSVWSEEASNYDFTHNTYYGDNTNVNQAVVDAMFSAGLKTLTGSATIQGAWQILLPNYQLGENIAVKVNFNDSIMGGGVSGYGDNDSYVDALPQLINALVLGLKTIGVAEENIWVYDASRYITNRFRERILYPGVRYFDHYGGATGVEYTGFTSSLSSAQINFSGTTYSGTHQITDILVEADYLINIPIMKRHGGAGITLALKNHLGSINGFYTGGHNMHNWFYLSGSNYTSSSNPIVNINNNVHIRNKTILNIGDALYGGWNSNNTPPTRWSSFGDDSPNMLFFACDPVALDSVMYDYLDREGYVNPLSEDVIILAAQAGLGVHERWNNDNNRAYSVIDYIEINLNPGQLPSAPNNFRIIN